MPGLIVVVERVSALLDELLERIVDVARGHPIVRRRTHPSTIVIGERNTGEAGRVADGVVVVSARECSGSGRESIAVRRDREGRRTRTGLCQAIAICIVGVTERRARLRSADQTIKIVVSIRPAQRGVRCVGNAKKASSFVSYRTTCGMSLRQYGRGSKDSVTA